MNLRPTKLNDIIGQTSVIECLSISINASKVKNVALPHLLFEAGPGLGKTTLALAIANEAGVPLQIANGANLRTVRTLLPYITKTEKHSILFIDEIHRLTKLTQELLYPVMEDFRLDLVNGEETVSIPLEPFTLIGATTQAGELTQPMVDRFPLKHQLTTYSNKELIQLLKINSDTLNLRLKDDAAEEISKRSRGVPRITNNLLKWVGDYCIAKGFQVISGDIVREAANMMGIDDRGLNEQDRRYINVLKRAGKPVGLKTLVAATNLNEDTILTQIEPFLLRQNIIAKESKGRVYCE